MYCHLSRILVLLWAVVAVSSPSAASAALKAEYKGHGLKVSIGGQNGPVVLYDDVLDQELARISPNASGVAEFNLTDLPVVPCRVRVEAGGKSVVKAVSGVDCKGTKAPPTCKILQPALATSIANGASLSFTGSVTGGRSRYLRYEWDFGGGADARSTSKNTGPVVFNFARDTQLWVTFTASDISGARCSDKVMVTVGMPPMSLPGKVQEQAPKVGDG